MYSLKNLKDQKGFTIVELLIVIVVIGILATLVIVTFTGIQQKARDTKRQTDINAINSHVEAYYAQHGNYPTLTDLNTASWRATNTKGLDPEALKDPKGSASTLAAAAVAGTSYGYDVSDDADASCEDEELDCTKYTLTAILEGNDTPYTKKSN